MLCVGMHGVLGSAVYIWRVKVRLWKERQFSDWKLNQPDLAR